jgi:hypothetical protein
VIDWREVRSGETLQDGCDAFDTAQLFVTLVGPEVALSEVEDVEPSPPFVPPPARVTAFAPSSNGGRRRAFDVGPFTVHVEPHEDDARQARFTEALAAIAVDLET